MSECKGKILGQLGTDGRMCIDFNPYEGRINSHMIAIGRSGVGKTFSFVKTFLIQAMKEKHSLFVADPKGDLYKETSSYFRDNGYVVRKLDLKDLEKSDGWHCMGSLHGANLITNTQIFSSTVMANISERDDVHSKAGGALLSALILRVLQGEEYSQENKNIKTVHELLQNPGGIDFLDTLLGGENLTSSEEVCTRFYMDFKKREEFRAAEAAYREEFWKTHEMHPDMRYSDISDALMTDQPESLWEMLLSMFHDDFILVKHWVKKCFNNAPEVKTEEKEDNILSNGTLLTASAEAGAFAAYYESYIANNKHVTSRLRHTENSYDEEDGFISLHVDMSTEKVMSTDVRKNGQTDTKLECTRTPKRSCEVGKKTDLLTEALQTAQVKSKPERKADSKPKPKTWHEAGAAQEDSESDSYIQFNPFASGDH